MANVFFRQGRMDVADSLYSEVRTFVQYSFQSYLLCFPMEDSGDVLHFDMHVCLIVQGIFCMDFVGFKYLV
jgi:hypothetical protein